LAREIAGAADDVLVLEYARAVAQAGLDLARIRRIKIALIQRISEFGELDDPVMQLSGTQMWRYLKSLYGGEALRSARQRCNDAYGRTRAFDRSSTKVVTGIAQARPLRASRRPPAR